MELRTKTIMKSLKAVTVGILVVTFLAAPLTGWGTEAKTQKEPAKAKSYPLKTCVVSDEKLGEMGDPFVFKYKDREVKLCCKSCKKDFDKNPEKFIKKIEKAEKMAKK